MLYRVRFKVGIISAILFIILSLMLANVASIWIVSSRTAKANAKQLFEKASRSAQERLDHLIGGTMVLASLGTTQAGMSTITGDGLDAPPLSFLFAALEANPSLYSLYYGFDDGTFLQVISARRDARILTPRKAPEATYWIVRTITNHAPAGTADRQGATPPSRIQTWTYLNRARQLIGTKSEPNPSYDPRKRPWYESSIAEDEAQLSAPYIYNSLKQPGITASKRLDNRHAVFGVDLTLTDLSQFVSKIAISEHGGLILIDETDRIISMSARLGRYEPLAQMRNVESTAVQAVLRLRREGATDGNQSVALNGISFLARYTDWQDGGRRIGIATVAPLDDFTAQFRDMQGRIVLLAIIGLMVFVPGALIFSTRMSRRVSDLAADARRVRNFDFSGALLRPSRIVEFFELGESFSLMKSDLSSRTKALEVAEDKLSRLVSLGIAMSAEQNSDKLMEMVLLGAKELTNADGGTLYIIGDDNKLDFQLIHNDTLGIALGGTSGNALNIPSVPLFDETGEPNHHNVVSFCVHEARTVTIPDAYDSSEFDFSGTRAFDERNGYRSRSFITVPLKPRGGDIIGALQLINAREPGANTPVPFSAEIQSFVEALSAQAATALYNRNLLDAQERLMDAMIQLLAGAIDAKSPYTGGHCERVPELAIMLAEEASRNDDRVFAEFRFETEEEWREFRIGAWLHDCGKVITPEYVVDKATKLETIYNRIHEIRTRFEVLLRDAEIDRLNMLSSGADDREAQSAFDQRKNQLIEDFTFVANCNAGGEFMKKEKFERLKEIAENTWLRHFDDRLGLSGDELNRHDEDAPVLPVTEKLLDDKSSHIVPRQGGGHKMYEDLGFKGSIPKHLYNYGELTNLSIDRGTLTEEERFKIKEHIMQTIAMLERLPFPKHLQRVPEYAGTHHEALNGSGYPRKLTKSELSIPARIMAIADIFEALTASDRPYKKAKTLSESVRILSFFKKDGHIDPDLFDLFLTTGVYQRYAERFLSPNQIDEVDIKPYLG